jgi:hypothetical protein
MAPIAKLQFGVQLASPVVFMYLLAPLSLDQKWTVAPALLL